MGRRILKLPKPTQTQNRSTAQQIGYQLLYKTKFEHCDIHMHLFVDSAKSPPNLRSEKSWSSMNFTYLIS